MGVAAGTRLGRYEIGTLIGAGGMGEVYRARDPTLRRDVAVKVLPERMATDGDRQRRFEREARAAAELAHPNILAVHDVGVEGGVPFIVTELLDGKTLADALRRGRLPRARALEIAVEIARGVAAAHEKGVVHRDLKPSNVFLCRDGRVKILDFGLAAHVTEAMPAGDDTTMTETGAILGTPAYMSPEQVRGQHVDPRADLFALGAILYEMLTGRRPFAGEGAVELGHAILTQDPEPLGDPALDAIVRRCLAKDPGARSHAAADVAFELETFGRLPAPPPRRSRFAWIAALAGLAALAALASGVVLWPSRGASPAPRYTRITFHQRIWGAARFAPDGRTVIHESWRAPELPRIFAATPVHPEARPITEPGARLLAVSSTGDMLVRIQTPDEKWVVARAALAGGVPRVIYDDVESADFSPDGSELAVVRNTGGLRRLEYPVGHVLFTTPFHLAPRVSPRGDKVAFVLWDSPTIGRFGGPFNFTGTVEVVGTDGTRRTLGQRWTYAIGAVWSPDGREIWFSGNRATEQAIYAIGLDGTERTVLDLPDFTHVVLRDIARDGRALMEIGQDYRFIAALVSGASGEVDLSWQVYSQLRDLSLDGRMVLFAGMGATPGREEAYVRKTDGSAAIHLGSGSPFALSPDGAWALVGPPEGSESSLTLVPTAAGERKLLSRGTIEHYAQAYFFSEGRRIAILAREPGHAMRVWIQDVPGGEPRPISDEGIRYLVRPAPDGDVVPACLDEDSCALYPVAGGQSRPLPKVRGLPLQLTPDGKSVIVGRGGVQLRHLSREPAALWVVDLATGSDRLLRRLDSGTHVTLMYTLRLTPDASGYAYTHVFSSYDVFLVEGLK